MYKKWEECDMYKRNKVCIYMFIVVMVLQIIIPALSVILETSYTLTSEAADNIIATWDNVGDEGSKITATLYNTGILDIKGTGKIKNNIHWYKYIDSYNYLDCIFFIYNVIISEGVEDIGKEAFKGCSELKSVQANHVKNIGESAFKRL